MLNFQKKNVIIFVQHLMRNTTKKFEEGYNMLIWILELIFIIVIMKFVEELGFVKSCVTFGVINTVVQLFASFNLFAAVSAFISGLVMGAVAFICAKIFLFLIDVLGALGKFLVVLILIAAFVAIIF